MTSGYEQFAADRSVTGRKNLRREVRQALGTSSDPAPTVMGALDAAHYLSDLLTQASGGRYTLVVRDLNSPSDGSAREAFADGSLKTIPSARARMQEAFEARFTVAGEPCPGFVIRGPYADQTYRLFKRVLSGPEIGRQHFIGQYATYDRAADMARVKAAAV